MLIYLLLSMDNFMSKFIIFYIFSCVIISIYIIGL